MWINKCDIEYRVLLAWGPSSTSAVQNLLVSLSVIQLVSKSLKRLTYETTFLEPKAGKIRCYGLNKQFKSFAHIQIIKPLGPHKEVVPNCNYTRSLYN